MIRSPIRSDHDNLRAHRYKPKNTIRMKFRLFTAILLSGILFSCGNEENEIRLQAYDTGAIRPTGWILNQMQRDLAEGFAGRLDLLTRRAGDSVFLHHRDLDWDGGDWNRDPRLKSYPDMYRWWDGESEGNWRLGLVEMAYMAGDSAAIRKISSYLDAVVEQSYTDGGYIGMFGPSARYKVIGDLWTQSLILKTLISYYRFTGNEAVKAAVITAVDRTIEAYGMFGEHRNIYDTNRNGHSLASYTDVAEELYRLTGDAKYIELARVLYKDFSSSTMIAGSRESAREAVDIQLPELLDPNKPFAEHAVHVVEQIRAPLFLEYRCPAEPVYAEARKLAFEKLARCITPSGNCIGDEWIFGRIGSPDIGHEYCVMTELLATCASCAEKTGDLSMADRMERLAFNAAQGARTPDGKAITYISTDNRAEARGVARYYSPTHEECAVCCNPNAVRFMPLYVKNMWMQYERGREKGIMALLYGPGILSTDFQGVDLRIEQRTSYPVEETMTFVITPARRKAVPLAFRIPEWAENPIVSAPGARIEEREGVIYVRKVWNPGDTVQLRFSAPIRQHTATNGEQYFTQGALLYALPIEATTRILKEYGCGEFADTEYVAAAADDGKYCISRSTIDRMTVEEAPVSEDRIWDSPCRRIEADFYRPDGRRERVALVPFGNTTLRRVTFPLRHFKE